MIEVGLNDGDYLEVCRHFRAVFDTPKIKADDEKAREVRIFLHSRFFVKDHKT